jgi:hypothetical protein
MNALALDDVLHVDETVDLLIGRNVSHGHRVGGRTRRTIWVDASMGWNSCEDWYPRRGSGGALRYSGGARRLGRRRVSIPRRQVKCTG